MPATANMAVENGKAALELARRSTLKLVDDIPEDKACHQPVAKCNHPLWVLGHLACTDNFFLTALGQRESVIDESWTPLFGMKSEPAADATKYPPLREVKTALQRSRQALIEWVNSMDDAQLQAPLPDDFKEFAPNYAGVLDALAWHEGLHAGQLSAVRRSLGLPHALDL